MSLTSLMDWWVLVNMILLVVLVLSFLVELVMGWVRPHKGDVENLTTLVLVVVGLSLLLQLVVGIGAAVVVVVIQTFGEVGIKI